MKNLLDQRLNGKSRGQRVYISIKNEEVWDGRRETGLIIK